LNGNWSGRKPPEKDDVVNGSDPAPRDGKRQCTFDQGFRRASYEQVGAMKRFCVDNGIVNNAQFPSVGQVDIQASPVGHDVNA
jgi:hypothetical protein